jgi:predicted nuclease of predicted toxin-antitoxin system
MLFIADENFPLPSVNKLRSAGHDVVAIITDSPGAADEEILTRAVRETRIILTFDRDFGELVFRLRLPPPQGIVYFRFDPATPMEPAEYLLRLLAELEVVLEHRFTVVDRRQLRQRPLKA